MNKLSKLTTATLSLFIFSQPVFAFSINFDWGDIRLCTSGTPFIVDNPAFTLKDLPATTSKIRFKLVDLNVPSYNHGGGTISYSGQTTIARGAFRYKSPCPPDGPHTYQWSATAINPAGKAIAIAKAKRKYPE